MTDKLIPLARVADELGVAPATLRSWRRRDEGPASFKMRGLIVYRRSVLDAWVAEQEAATSKGQQAS